MKNLLLLDREPGMVKAWSEVFHQTMDPIREPEVTIACGDLENILRQGEPEVFITAGNSFGVMDGGIDLALRRIMPKVQEEVLFALHQRGSFLPIGDVLTVETGIEWCPYVIYAPTMHVPEHVRGLNAFLAFHAALVCARDQGFDRVAGCGLATASGGFSFHASAMQMRVAVEFMSLPPLPGADGDGVNARYGSVFDATRWAEASRRYRQLQEVWWHG